MLRNGLLAGLERGVRTAVLGIAHPLDPQFRDTPRATPRSGAQRFLLTKSRPAAGKRLETPEAQQNSCCQRVASCGRRANRSPRRPTDLQHRHRRRRFAPTALRSYETGTQLDLASWEFKTSCVPVPMRSGSSSAVRCLAMRA